MSEKAPALVAEPRNETARAVELPERYYLDERDPDVAVLRRDDGAFVAAFSAMGATREGIVEAAEENNRAPL